jgi:nucleoid-associated protein EbfC
MGRGFAKQKKQAKAMQEKFLRLQEEMASQEVEGSAGNGLVTVRLNGEHKLLSVKIKPECVDPDDIEGLEDLICAAHAQALEQLNAQSSQGMPDLGAFGL